ncbi:MAG: endonuclease III [Candidatus Aegiribacteria sp.]|nr:endonuclease III [Candidatus Aegiribacteria sp.]
MKNTLKSLGIPAPMEESREAFPVLISTIISLRTRDAVTRMVSRQVLTRAPDIDAMISIDIKELEQLLRPAGFYRQKAGQMKRIAKILKNNFEGRVPGSMDSLLTLPGVGRKTANFVMGMVFGVPSICVDVHVHRISNRLGLVNTRSPEETEFALQKLFPIEEWTGINHIMVRFGQRICRPAKPLCNECPLREGCPSGIKEKY